MKMAIKFTLIAIPVVIIIILTIVVFRLDSIARNVVQTQSTVSTNLTTTLDTAHISIFGGNVKLKKLRFASPKGFEATPTMFEMGDIDVKVGYGELRATPMHIGQITVDSPRLVVEQRGGTLNINAAMSQMPQSSEPSTLRMTIGTLQVNNTQLVIRPGLPLLKPEYQFVLPSVELKNVGVGEGAQNGAAIQDVLKQILVATMQRLRESDSIPAEIRPWLASAPGDLAAQARQEIDRRANELIDQGKLDGQKKLEEGLGGILNRKAK